MQLIRIPGNPLTRRQRKTKRAIIADKAANPVKFCPSCNARVIRFRPVGATDWRWRCQSFCGFEDAAIA